MRKVMLSHQKPQLHLVRFQILEIKLIFGNGLVLTSVNMTLCFC